MSVDGPLGEWLDQSEEASTTAESRVSLVDPAVAEVAIKRAFRVVHIYLGRRWLEREISEKSRNGYLMIDGPNDADEEEEEQFVRQHRLLALALELERAEGIAGFEDLLRSIRTRSMYEAVAELRAVNLLQVSGEQAWFMSPTGSPGKTYDATVVLSGIEVAVEVKAKTALPLDQYHPRKIESSLRKARGQLPAAGPSMIYLQLTTPWSVDAEVMVSIETTIHRWLENTRRVNAVILMLEGIFPRKAGGMRFTQARLNIINRSVHKPVPDLQGWLPD